MTVRLYQSTDVGAPSMHSALTTIRGDLNAVLKACLVTGYGSQPPAGWTIVFEDVPNNIIHIKNSDVGDGTGTVFCIEDSYDHRFAAIYGVQDYTDSMTRATTRFPQSGYNYIVKRNTNAAAPVGDWYIIACERGAYIAIQNRSTASYGNATGFWTISFIGDIASYVAGDPYCGTSIVSVGNTNSYLRSISGLVGDNNLLFADIGQATASSSSALAADHTGFLVSTDYSLTSNQRACGLDAYFNNTGGFNYPDTITGRTVYSRIYASHHNSIRGEIPGIVFPCHPRPFTTFFVDLPQEGAFVGQNWFILPKMTTSTDGGALTYLSTFAIRYNCDTSDWYSV